MSPTTIPGNLILQSPTANDPLLDLNTQPSLDLQFATGKTLNDRVSGFPLVNHQRDASSGKSAGTYVGSDGLIKTSVVNLLPYSENFSASTNWGQYAVTASITNGYQAPFGGLAASKYTPTASYDYSRIGGVMPSSTSNVETFSVYVKANGINFVTLRLDTVSGQTARTFNLLTGEDTVGVYDNNNLSPNTPASSAVYVKDGWWRISITGTFAQPPNTFIYPCADATTSRTTWNGTDSFYIFGAQLQEGTTATDYVPTTNLPSGAPRFDHDPVTGESLGLLIEESRTNVTYPSDFSQYFTYTNPAAGVPTRNYGTAPDGTVSSCLYEPSVTAVARSTAGAGVAAGTYTVSVFYKGDRPNGVGGPGTNSALSDIQTFPNGWTRAAATLTFTGGGYLDITLLAGTSVELWGVQSEVGSFPTSYIPTTTSAVTRAADVASIEGTNFSSWYNQSEGTMFSDTKITFDDASVSQFPAVYMTNGYPNRLWSLLIISGNNIIAIGADAFSNNFGSGVSSPQTFKVAQAISNTTSTYSASKDGGAVIAGSVSAVADQTIMSIGPETGGTKLIKRLTYYPYRLADATLQEITS